MSAIGPVIAASGSLGLMYAERLLPGVTAENFARFARPGGVEIRSNHPAFVFGHLSLYPTRVMAALDLPTGRTQPPANYEALFKNGVECRDDPEGTIYPAMAEVTAFYFEAYRTAVNAVATAADHLLTRPNPAEGRMRELFPTLGAAVNFYLGGHVQVHLGQISAWRRMMGLPTA